MQKESMSAREGVSAAVAAAFAHADEAHIVGTYHATCVGPREEDRARYVALRDAIAAEEAKPLAARDYAALNAMQDELDAIPLEQKWADEVPNVVANTGKNSMLDNFLAGSAFTQVGPYMGLISSVGWTNLATTISSGTYTTGTGAVSLTTAAAHGLSPGDSFTIASAAGTGSFAAINGTFVAGSGTTGSTLNFTIAASLTMTITGGNVTTASGTRIADTMASHGNWTEAGSTNAPTFSARGTMSWSAAASGAKATSAATSFSMTGAGTLEGCFIVLATGAVSTLMSTAGTLFSAGAFSAGAKTVANGDTVNVSYSVSV